jgi:hypothetical protein
MPPASYGSSSQSVSVQCILNLLFLSLGKHILVVKNPIQFVGGRLRMALSLAAIAANFRGDDVMLFDTQKFNPTASKDGLDVGHRSSVP